jgi:hypothetical protein
VYFIDEAPLIYSVKNLKERKRKKKIPLICCVVVGFAGCSCEEKKKRF